MGGLAAGAHWDFYPKFISHQYYSTLEGVLGIPSHSEMQTKFQELEFVGFACCFSAKRYNKNQKTYKYNPNQLKMNGFFKETKPLK